MTPKTTISVKSRSTYRAPSECATSVKTTTTTREKYEQLKIELDNERKKRVKAEMEIEKLNKINNK